MVEKVKETLDDKLAQLLEKMQTLEGKVMSIRSNRGDGSLGANRFNSGNNYRPIEEVTCYHCQVKGHYKSGCPELVNGRGGNASSTELKSKQICYHCSVQGHIRAECPLWLAEKSARNTNNNDGWNADGRVGTWGNQGNRQ